MEKRTRSRAGRKPAVDYLMACVKWGRLRRVLVFIRDHAGRRWIRLRVFNKHFTKGCWYPSRRYFVVPMECAKDLGRALIRAADEQQTGETPEWFCDWERSYAAFKAECRSRDDGIASANGSCEKNPVSRVNGDNA